MILDASAAVEWLLGTEAGQKVEAVLRNQRADSLDAPALLDVEVAQTVRRLVHRGTLADAHGKALVEILQDLPVHRHRIDPLLPRIWDLRDHLTAYDAAYVALGEALEAPVLTFDSRIAGAPGLLTEIVVPG